MQQRDIHPEFHATECPCRFDGNPEFAPVVVTNRNSSFLHRIGVPTDVIVGDQGVTVMVLFAQGPNRLPLPFGADEIERYSND